jgi:hypothetical protein
VINRDQFRSDLLGRARTDASSTCLYTFNVVSTLARHIRVATVLAGTDRFAARHSPVDIPVKSVNSGDAFHWYGQQS